MDLTPIHQRAIDVLYGERTQTCAPVPGRVLRLRGAPVPDAFDGLPDTPDLVRVCGTLRGTLSKELHRRNRPQSSGTAGERGRWLAPQSPSNLARHK